MSKTTLHNILSVILLIAMTIEMGVKSLHQHHHAESEETECQMCIDHSMHSGHIENEEEECCDCILCQLLSTPYVESATIRHLSPYYTYQFVHSYSQSSIGDTACCCISPRGPPPFFLS